ncbi:MAG TPA: cell division protein FtsL [Thiotrichaceae bacterium]|nr:cell division protein FtsL [Thiotrichaceae bacterium]
MKFLVLLLISAVFVSALQVVLARHQNRMLFIERHQLQQQGDALRIYYGQLQLEQSTLAQPHRIETIARDKLNMIIPAPNDIILIRD